MDSTLPWKVTDSLIALGVQKKRRVKQPYRVADSTGSHVVACPHASLTQYRQLTVAGERNFIFLSIGGRDCRVGSCICVVYACIYVGVCPEAMCTCVFRYMYI